MTEQVAQAHHQRMCRYPYGYRLMPAADPFGRAGFRRYDPAGWFAFTDNGGSLIAITDIDQCIQLLQA
jgi:hypothetical protein